MASNNYYCAECGAPATKEPIVVQRRDSKLYGLGSLGSWRCTGGCKGGRSKVKVRREKVREKSK